jgi:MoCo/4Fe-4S cofactor protein with predicted Tat translocation signal
MENKVYWKGFDELEKSPDFIARQHDEFPEELPIEEILSENIVNKPTARRDFLKYLGFSVSTAALLAACRIPVRKVVPYVVKPEEIIPGIPDWYASTFLDGSDYCSILVKTREGRPIKIEGNTFSNVTKGGTSARAQASILQLYDKTRATNPAKNGKPVSWTTIDEEMKDILSQVKEKNGNIRILSGTIMSPSTLSVIGDFIKAFPNTKHIQYEPISLSGMRMANQKSFGASVIPGYNFDKAKVIVGFAADFLGTWISPIEFTKQFVKNRKITKDNPVMSRHYHFESQLSLTGSNADKRAVYKPSQEGNAVLALYNKIASQAGKSSLSNSAIDNNLNKMLGMAAIELWNNKGQSLVVAGSNDVNVQLLVNEINSLLGNYGSTIDLQNYSNAKQGDDAAMMGLVDEMKNGKVDALIIYNANPAYDYFHANSFTSALKNVGTTISLNDRPDETSILVKYHCPDHHYLESWNDAEPRKGMFSLGQPAISPIFNTRQAQDSLLMWMNSGKNYHEYIQDYWQKNIFTASKGTGSYEEWWDNTLKYGILEVTETSGSAAKFNDAAISSAVDAINKNAASNGLELVLYEKVGIGNGRYANNPWLQEMPDPISKITWDNYLCVSKKLATDKAWNDGDLVTLKNGNNSIDLPVFTQPGMQNDTVAVALGYGRTNAGRAGDNVGKNAFPFISTDGNTMLYWSNNISISPKGGTYDLALTQMHYTIEGRPVIREASLGDYKKNPAASNEDTKEYKESHYTETLYNPYQYPGNKWAMTIDLNSCIGCGACVMGCQVENNVPVVGKNEVHRAHEMHWIRIDRYYSFTDGNGKIITKEKDYSSIADYQNVEVTFQPMLCQHCENAPCENVCPVAATNHSSEGLNQMVYNRCVGTRYCENNCPYKVRRFNWLDYNGADSFPWNEKDDAHMQDALTRMVFNPDVTVRSRGVMEKCSFCVQKIQDAKLGAKRENRELADGDIKTACQTACPADAIVFGNINDKSSEVKKINDDERTFYVLEDLHTLPSIGYLTKIRNNEDLV